MVQILNTTGSCISICSGVIGDAMGDFPRQLFFQLTAPLIHRTFTDIHCRGSCNNGVMLIEYEPGSFEAKLGAKITSVTSGHNVTVFDCEVMISPLFRWPNLVCHYTSSDITS